MPPRRRSLGGLRRLLGGLWLALLPLLAGAGTPVLRMGTTVGPGPGVNVMAFIDQVEIVNAATGQVVAAAVPNAGFETSGALSNGDYGFTPTGATWSFAGTSGIASNGSALAQPTAPEGTRVAFLQTISNRAGAISQTLPNLPAGAYQVRARVAQRPGNTAPQGVTFAVDGAELGSIVPGSSTSYDTYLSPAFIVDAVLRLEALGSASNAADVTAFVDQVELLNVRDGSNVPVTNASFETTGSLGTGAFGYAPTGTGWDFNSRSGIATNGSIFNNPNAPDGLHVGILQSSSGINGAFEQQLAAVPVTGLRVRLWAVQRTATVPDQRVRVLLNGQEVGRFQPSGSFQQYTLPSASTSFTLSISLPPTLTALSPLIGGPGTGLTLTGTNLAGTTSINFTGAAGVKTVTTGFTINAAGTQIMGVVVPAGAQSGPITATNGAGTSPVGAALFSRATTLGAGGLHSAQVRPDGTLWTWGYNDQGQQGNGSLGNTVYLIPQRVGSASSWVSVSAGQYFTLALRADGTLWSWGKNASGQLGRPSTAADQGLPTQVGSASSWVSISAGADHALALRADGTLWAWGDNTYGQLGLGDLVNRAAPVQVPGGGVWASASAGGFHSVAVRADGSAWAWGRNHYGQLGQNGQVQQTSPTPVYGGTTTWVSVSAGYLHTVALQANGTLWTWGANYVGQLGQGNTNNIGYPVQVGSATSWLSADAGDVHSLGLRADGTLYAWGDNTAGQLGLGDNAQRTAPAQVGGLTNWADAVGGNTHSLAAQSCEALWAWGGDNGGQLGNGDNTFTNRNAPVRIVSPTSLLSFFPSSAAAGTTVAVTGTGLLGLTALTVNGANALASVTNNTNAGFSFVVPAGATLGAGTVTVAAGCGSASSTGFTVLPRATLTALSPRVGLPGTVLTLTGTNLAGTTSVNFTGAAGTKTVTTGFTVNAAGTQITGVVVPTGAQSGAVTVTTGAGTSAVAGGVFFTRAVTLAQGTYHAASIRPDGTLWTWGRNNAGQLGLGNQNDRNTPTQVGTGTSWVSVAAGGEHTVAVRGDGTLWAWGANEHGELGLGDQNNRSTPTQVGTGTSWVSVTAGNSYTLALRTDGTLWAWGSNLSGELGLGTTNFSNPTPQQVGISTNWVSMDAGQESTLATQIDGSLWAWGANTLGQLGLSNANNYVYTPQRVGTGSGWVSVAAANYHTAATQADGTLWTWGDNYVGQLGLGDQNNRSTPTQVGTGTSWVSPAASHSHTLAVQANGTAWAWGRNDAGQLGLGHTTAQSTPQQIGTSTSWVRLTGGFYTSAGEQTCRAVWTWGLNSNGQLGDGTTTQRTSPVLVINPVRLLTFSPTSAGAGNTVAVTGTGLLGLTALTVNGINALPSVTNNTDSGFSFVVPTGAALGAANITVAAGCGSASSSAFTVILPPAPTITGLNPGSGPLGTSVLLTGTNLATLTSVQFGGVPAVFSVQSATQATVVVPVQAVNQRVRVTSPSGTGLSAAAFQVTRPSPSGVFPAAANLTSPNGSIAASSGAVPAVTDLDGDSRLDLLVGDYEGTIQRFEQTTAGGSDFTLVGLLTTPSGTLNVGNGATPTATDLDGDGRVDLLVGEIYGTIMHYEQTTAGGNEFTQVGLLATPTGTITVDTRPSPTVTDVDGDGLLDLLVGSTNDNVVRFEQTTVGGAVFAALGALTTDGTAALTVTWGKPTVTDLDADGLLDLVVGEYSGNVQRFEQTTPGGSAFAPLGRLTLNGSSQIFVRLVASPAVTDVDGDGLLDLLVGNSLGNITRFEQFPVPTLTSLSTSAELPGQAVTLTGTGFVNGSTVRFGGVAAASVTYASATQLTAVVPVSATPGTAALTVGTYDVASAAPASPAFEVLQVYRTAAASGCLSTAPLTIDGTGGTGKWRYLRLPGAGGAVVAAIEDTRNLGSVTAQVLALGTGTSAAVRDDGRGRRYLDRNFALTATNKSFPGQSVRVRFFGLSSELDRLTAADPAATAARLNLSQYSGLNEDCDLTNNGVPTDRRVLPAPATKLSGADWFVAEATVAEHFSEFYLTAASAPLPVELTQFTATAEGAAAVRLAWTTASEKNSASFEVERSLDGRTFTAIGTVAAAGSSTTRRSYALLDNQLPKSISPQATLYYRLRQVDTDGTVAYSPVRPVVLSGAGAGLSLYPNPARGGAATLTGATPGAAVHVLDALGREVLTTTADASGTAALALPARHAPGVYVVRVGATALRLVVD